MNELEKTYRQTGRTTRLIDYYVQKLFENWNMNGGQGYIDIEDHYSTISSNKMLMEKIKNRIEREHHLECDMYSINKMRIKPKK